MFQRLLARVGIAVLSAGVALGTAGTANAQHHAGGHAGGGHAGGGHAGGGHAVIPHTGGGYGGGGRAAIPHAAYGGTYRGGVGTNFHHAYGGQSFYRGGVGANYNHNYGGHNYYRGGNGYYRPGYSGYGYYPRSNFGLGINLGGLGFGYAYPRYYGSYGYAYPSYYGSYGYSYPYGAYAGSSAYYPPDYASNDVAVVPSESYYPPAEPAPAVATSAKLTVQVPADARLWIDGQPTAQTGSVRYFETPATLEPGRTYSYKLTAEWVENGQTVTRERVVEFQAGNQAVVNMTVL
jgi:uncharacterized protein (TIGR03000 family)